VVEIAAYRRVARAGDSGRGMDAGRRRTTGRTTGRSAPRRIETRQTVVPGLVPNPAHVGQCVAGRPPAPKGVSNRPSTPKIAATNKRICPWGSRDLSRDRGRNRISTQLTLFFLVAAIFGVLGRVDTPLGAGGRPATSMAMCAVPALVGGSWHRPVLPGAGCERCGTLEMKQEDGGDGLAGRAMILRYRGCSAP